MAFTEIDYIETVDNMYKLDDFRNILSKGDMTKKFGDEVTRAYLTALPRYYKRENGWEFTIHYPDQTYETVGCGDIMSAQVWERFLKTLKQSGERLHAIRKAVAGYQTRTIVI